MLRSILLLIPVALFAVDGPAVKAGYAQAGTYPISTAPIVAPAFLAIRAPQAKALAGSTSVRAVGPVGELPWLKVRREGGKLRGR